MRGVHDLYNKLAKNPFTSKLSNPALAQQSGRPNSTTLNSLYCLRRVPLLLDS